MLEMTAKLATPDSLDSLARSQGEEEEEGEGEGNTNIVNIVISRANMERFKSLFVRRL